MEKVLQGILEKSPRQILSSLDLEQRVQGRLSAVGRGAWSYVHFARAMDGLVERGLLAPVRASGYNGRIPPLAVRYRRTARPVSPPPEMFQFRSRMDLSYFARRPREFYRCRGELEAIDKYLLEFGRDKPPVWDTLNERSFQLTGDEKFLASAKGAALLGRIRIGLADLHCYHVAEPFFYQLLESEGDQAGPVNVLIIENKDSFHTICRLLKQGFLLLIPPISLAIYGQGNKITGSWPFLSEIPGLAGKTIRAYYYGDLDPMGLTILGRLQKAVQRAARMEEGPGLEVAHLLQILPAQGLYRFLLKQGRYRELKGMGPDSAKCLDVHWGRFAPDLRRAIEELWEGGRMIPQEALSASRLAALKEIAL